MLIKFYGLKLNKIILFALCTLLYGCSISHRANSKISWLKSRGFIKEQVDTVFKIDTIKGFRIDTVAYFDSIHTVDTLTAIKDGVSVKTVVKWKERIVQQEIIKADTVIRYITKISKTEIKCPDKLPWWVWPSLIACFVAILGLVFRRLGG